MALPPPPEIARRVRAAFAYAGQDVTKDHPELGIGKSTVARIVSPSTPRGADHGELERVAAFTGVPLVFLLDGWPAEEPALDERIESVEHQLATIRVEIGESRRAAATALADLGATVARHTREIAALRSEDRPGRQAEGNGR